VQSGISRPSNFFVGRNLLAAGQIKILIARSMISPSGNRLFYQAAMILFTGGMAETQGLFNEVLKTP